MSCQIFEGNEYTEYGNVMEEKISGIVLGGISFGENDKILNIFTLEKGVISAKIKGVKKAGAKLKFASEPFCFAEFIFMKKGENKEEGLICILSERAVACVLRV